MNKAISLALLSITDEGADEGLNGQLTMHLVWDVYKGVRARYVKL